MVNTQAMHIVAWILRNLKKKANGTQYSFLKATYLYAGIQTSGLLDVVNKINIWYNVTPYEVNTDLPCSVSSKMTNANQLENRRNNSHKA